MSHVLITQLKNFEFEWQEPETRFWTFQIMKFEFQWQKCYYVDFPNHEIWVSMAKVLLWYIGEAQWQCVVPLEAKVLIPLGFNYFLFHFQTAQATLYFNSLHFLLCFGSFHFQFVRRYSSYSKDRDMSYGL